MAQIELYLRLICVSIRCFWWWCCYFLVISYHWFDYFTVCPLSNRFCFSLSCFQSVWLLLLHIHRPIIEQDEKFLDPFAYCNLSLTQTHIDVVFSVFVRHFQVISFYSSSTVLSVVSIGFFSCISLWYKQAFIKFFTGLDLMYIPEEESKR